MNPFLLDFDALLTPGAWIALWPMVTLAVGLMMLLLAEVVPALRRFRSVFFLASLGIAALFELRILDNPDALTATGGLVLDGSLIANATSAVWGLIFLTGTALAFCYSTNYYTGSEARYKDEHDILMLTAPLGMMLMAGAGDLVVFFLGLELLSIPLYILAAYKRSQAASVEAGLKYFLLGAFASALFVYGSALLYAETGALSLGGLADHFATHETGTLAMTGIGLITASLLFKISVFPFHVWVPDVYQGSPTPVTALMATGTKAAAIAFMLNALFLLPGSTAPLIATLGIITMAIGYLGALVQEDLKRMLAYSGIASAGTVILVIAGALASPDSLASAQTAALYYIGAYVFTITGAFGLIALFEKDGAQFTRLSSLSGLAKSRPGMAAAMTLFVLSLGGIPATGGFLGKWFVFSVLVEANMITFAVIGAVLSVIALAFYLKIVITMWMLEADESQPIPGSDRPLIATVATAICVIGVLATGILPSLFLPS
ncbi:MAG: NADH-quinone oxidoreductase subunit N [Planctomycetota bacterium]|jgi:NADH-quinone oxidoreductase subunit N